MNTKISIIPFSKKRVAFKIWYLISKDGRVEFCPERFNLDTDSVEAYALAEIFKLKGSRMSKTEAMLHINKFVDEWFALQNDKYISKSNKKSFLVDGECHTYSIQGDGSRPNIGMLDFSVNFSEYDINNIRKEALKNRSKYTDDWLIGQGIDPQNKVEYVNWYIKDYCKHKAKHTLVSVYNISKKNRKQTAKTKINTVLKDIENLLNPHVDSYDEEGYITDCHVHGLASMFDPKTGLYLSAKNYGELFQEANLKVEQKFKDVLQQGVALGFHQTNGANSVDELRQFYSDKDGDTEQQVKQHLKILGRSISQVLEQDGSLEQKIAMLNVLGIDMSLDSVRQTQSRSGKFGKDAEQIFNFKDKKTGITFNNYSFSGKDKYAISAYAKKLVSRQKKQNESNKQKNPFDLDKVEAVIQDRLKRTRRFIKSEIETRQIEFQDTDSDELRSDKEKFLKDLKLEAFKRFSDSLVEVGIVIEVNYQGHLVYWKNNPSDLTKYHDYKSSLFSKDLLGKNIVQEFELSRDDLIDYGKTEYMAIFQNHKYSKHIKYLEIGESQSKTLDEYYTLWSLNKAKSNTYDYLYDGKTLSILSKKSQRPLIQATQIDDKTIEYSSNTHYPEQAARAILNHGLDDIRNAEKGTTFTYGMSNPNQPLSEEMKHLHVMIIFSKDKLARERLKVDTSNATGLDELIEKEMDKQLGFAEKAFEKNLAKAIKDKKYNFTNSNALLHLIDNPDIPYSQQERARELLNKQISMLLANDVVNLKSNYVNLDSYISMNYKAINDKANLVRKEKASQQRNSMTIH
ncbi:hypothetical protein OTK51_13300 [Vibrio scophthalmi]|uniref:hypothetical protein n=1 Tax=Vibrio scophthalmi TaxID=45658 RepID=UPI002283E9DB|nr:hypothetical protein [Vibrio scophthalmi]MCY9804404.1 hypothetical protein [Vibrio scophthalmi]